MQYQVLESADQSILLIYGLGFDQTGWRLFGDKLAEHFRVISSDARGVGSVDIELKPFNT
jgi:pimeloyl-ACP methyl ester carboxylesterase